MHKHLGILAVALASCVHEPLVGPAEAPTSAPESPAAEPPPPEVPSAVAPVPYTSREQYDVIAADLVRLHEAGDADRCRHEMADIQRELARDERFTDADLRAEREGRDTRNRGPMPYPSPGTACAIFGIQTILEGALNDRAGARGEPAPYPADTRPLVVGGE